jgi:hypothetical protein
MTNGRLIVHDRETFLELDRPAVAGDTVAIIRGNGVREGDSMGTATITGFDENGAPVLTMHLFAKN